jgi:hypothetical protein
LLRASPVALNCGIIVGGRRLVGIAPVHFNPWHRRSPPAFVHTWSDLLLARIVTFVIVYALILAATYVVDSREKMPRQSGNSLERSLPR